MFMNHDTSVMPDNDVTVMMHIVLFCFGGTFFIGSHVYCTCIIMIIQIMCVCFAFHFDNSVPLITIQVSV